MANEEGPPAPDTGTQTPAGPLTLWRYADAPESVRKLTVADVGERHGRWIALIPADALTGSKDDDYWPNRRVPIWSTGWERTWQIAFGMDGCADPIYYFLKDGRVIVLGRE